MTTLPTQQADIQQALQAAHAHLRLSPYNRTRAYEKYDREHAIRVAGWYINEVEPAADKSPTELARCTYNQLCEVISEQFNYLTGTAGIKVRFTVEDPYTSSADMFEQFFRTGELRVFKTQESLHPIWPDIINDRFRAVHDLFGHCTWLNSFGPKGEDAAYLSHAATLPTEVLPAICSETRGQNATFNYGHLVDGRAPNQYARQSWLLAPMWVWMKGL